MASKKVEVMPEAAYVAAEDAAHEALCGTPAPQWIAEELARAEAPWLLYEAILPGGLTIVSGRPKAGKSFVAYLMAMSLASGREFGPFVPTGRHTSLYVDLEGVARQTARRLDLLCLGHDVAHRELEPLRVVHGVSVELTAPAMAARLVQAIETTEAEVVFLDTFARSFTGDENAKKDVGKYLDVLYDVRQATGVAAVLVHHTNKQQLQYKDVSVPFDPDGGLRGSSAIAGAYDVIFSLQAGWVEGEYLDVMMSQGKYTGGCWWDYALRGDKAHNHETGRDEFVRSWLEFGSRRDELGFFERAPEARQPKFKSPKNSE